MVTDRLGVGVLVSLGGEIATAGPAGSAACGAWETLVQDGPADPAALIAVPAGLAVATSTSVQGDWLSATVVAPDRTVHVWGGWPLDAEVRPVPASAPAALSTPAPAGGV